ncbi:MAG TPA: hypothetical protein PLD12_08835 [Bacteroidales bacterium]|nr:hypothetical protein [Bacteroidales bacterium]HPO65421.1 hypothetical protein [Bacteroidales bacterium]
MIWKEILILILSLFGFKIYCQEPKKLFIDSTYKMDDIVITRLSENQDTLKICYLNEFYPDYSKGGKIIITHHRSHEGVRGYEEINFYNEIENKIILRNQLKKVSYEPYFFDLPIYFKYRIANTNDFEQFIIIRALFPGTGNLSEDYIYRLTSDDGKSYKIEYEIQPFNSVLKKGQGVWKGPILDFNENLNFITPIWNEGDANCCPSGGDLIGNFKLFKINNKYYFKIEKYKIIEK